MVEPLKNEYFIMRLAPGIFTGTVFLLSGIFAPAFAQGNSLAIAPTVVAAGGGFMSGTAGSIQATLGQPLAANGNALLAGFWHARRSSAEVGTDVVSDEPAIPPSYSLFQNYPNPFRGSTMIRYELPEQTSVELTVLNILGQTVDVLYSGEQTPGTYRFLWEGRSSNASNLSSGVYLYRLRTPHYVKEMRMVLLK